MGEKGFGLLEAVDYPLEPDVIMGSFSKTFASNGGFVLGSPAIYEYLSFHSNTHLFSNALSPVLASVVLQAAEVVFSAEGQRLRGKLMQNVLALREAMIAQGITVGGVPSPIVPVFVGDQGVARIASGLLLEEGLLANLVEFPAVARGTARFRFQVMPSHTREMAEEAAQIVAGAINAPNKKFTGSGSRMARCKWPNN